MKIFDSVCAPCLLKIPSLAKASIKRPQGARRVGKFGFSDECVEIEEAVKHLTALNALAGFRPQVAILDIGLPGMTGYELARRFRADANGAAMTLIALTGWGQAEDRRNAHEAGFDHHLTKHVSPQAVTALIT